MTILHLCFHRLLLRASSLIPSAYVDYYHLVLIHLKTLFKGSMTALVLSLHIHSMTRHILSTITSHGMRKTICIHLFMAVCRFLHNSSPMEQDHSKNHSVRCWLVQKILKNNTKNHRHKKNHSKKRQNKLQKITQTKNTHENHPVSKTQGDFEGSFEGSFKKGFFFFDLNSEEKKGDSM